MNIYPPSVPYIDVVSAFGADPSGSSDASAAINAALAQAPALAGTGIVLWFRPGQYNCLNPLLIRGTTNLWGSGSNLTQFYAPGVTGALIKSNNTAVQNPHSHLSGFTINGGNSTTLTAGIDVTGFNTPTLDEIQVLNISTAGAAGFLANGGVAATANPFLSRLWASGIVNGAGFNLQSINGIQASSLNATLNQQGIVCSSLVECNFANLLASDNTATADAGSLKINGCNRINIHGYVALDNTWIGTFVNASQNINLSDVYISDNNQAINVGNGGMLYVSGAKHCSFNNINLEFTFATPSANSNALTLDNTSGGQNVDTTWRNLHIQGNGHANTNAIHWIATGLRNDYDSVRITGCATNEAPNETFNPGRFISLGGIVTRSRGQATIAGAGTSIVVNHTLVTTPTWVRLTPLTDAGSPVRYWVDTLTATQFTVHCAPQTTNALTFEWSAGVGDGP